MTACFTGHRIIEQDRALEITQKLSKTIESLIERGVKDFRSGGAIGFDTVAALKVIEYKEKYPDIKLHMLLPCREQTKGWNEYCIRVYEYILSHADEIVYISEHYYSGCMHARNRALVNGSDVCVAYCTNERSGTYYTLSYAKKSGLEVVWI